MKKKSDQQTCFGMAEHQTHIPVKISQAAFFFFNPAAAAPGNSGHPADNRINPFKLQNDHDHQGNENNRQSHQG